NHSLYPTELRGHCHWCRSTSNALFYFNLFAHLQSGALSTGSCGAPRNSLARIASPRSTVGCEHFYQALCGIGSRCRVQSGKFMSVEEGPKRDLCAPKKFRGHGGPGGGAPPPLTGPKWSVAGNAASREQPG